MVFVLQRLMMIFWNQQQHFPIKEKKNENPKQNFLGIFFQFSKKNITLATPLYHRVSSSCRVVAMLLNNDNN